MKLLYLVFLVFPRTKALVKESKYNLRYTAKFVPCGLAFKYICEGGDL